MEARRTAPGTPLGVVGRMRVRRRSSSWFRETVGGGMMIAGWGVFVGSGFRCLVGEAADVWRCWVMESVDEPVFVLWWCNAKAVL